MKYVLVSIIGMFVLSLSCFAQDSRERTYYYENLEPRHEPKPQIEGFAKQRVEENLNRGLVAAKNIDGKGLYLSWRLLKTDSQTAQFNVYRSANGKVKKLNSKPIINTTDFTDTTPVPTDAIYWIDAVENKKSNISEKITVNFLGLNQPNYKSIKLKDSVKAGKVAVADLNGDGIYDYIIRHPHTNIDPGMPGDTIGTTFKIEAYLSDGTYLWTKDLGEGIEPGIWYSPFVAYDFNGDGKAEVAIKIAGTDLIKNDKGRVCGGSEYLAILDGMTGKEIAKADWPERNDRYGNLIRQNRNQMGIAFLDGKLHAF